MKLSEYIAKLEVLKGEHGDLDVETDGPFTGRIQAYEPKLAYRAILRGRCAKDRFWRRYWEGNDKGEKVIEV